MKPIHTSPLAILTLLASLAGCTVFPNGEPPRVMDIAVAEQPPARTPGFGKTLRVDTPHATEPFDSSRILTKPSPREFQVYGGVRWRDTAPVVVREVLIASLRDEGRFDGVTNESSPTASDLTLSTDLYGFHSETFGDQPRVVITLYGQLMDNRTRETLCTGNFAITRTVSARDVDAVVDAFGRGGEQLGQELRAWLSSCLD